MATGNPRNKVALKPGHSLMDWIRLGNSGVDLSGTKGAILDVTPAELRKHQTREDAWICIRGKVYNITRYLDFHPGGVEELMKGAGKDGTTLFNEVHAWVNYESILQKCLVGRLRSTVEEDVFSLPNPFLQPSTSKGSSAIKPKPPSMKWDWFEKMNEIFICFYSKNSTLIHLSLSPQGNFWAKIDNEWKGLNLSKGVVWPPDVNRTLFKAEIVFKKSTVGLWNDLEALMTPPPYSQDFPPFWDVKVSSISQVNHNVYLISLQYIGLILNYIPTGWHITLKSNIKGRDIERPYTPIEALAGQASLDNGKIWLLIKNYPDGIFSHWITSCSVEDSLLVSLPTGAFKESEISRVDTLILLAAGTGITPMIRLINLGLKKVRMISLKFFNKTERDIIWKDEFSTLSEQHESFEVEHILSDPSSTWQGRRGWVTPKLLEEFFPEFSPASPMKFYICICGPLQFTQLVESYVQQMGYPPKSYFCFRG